MKTNTPVTLYNKLVVDGAETYYRHVILSVAWESLKGQHILQTGGQIAADQATVYIPYVHHEGFLKPKNWVESEFEDVWTLQVGDLIVKGEVEDEIEGSFTASKLRAKYDDVLSIKTVDFQDMGSRSLWHWQIGAS